MRCPLALALVMALAASSAAQDAAAAASAAAAPAAATAAVAAAAPAVDAAAVAASTVNAAGKTCFQTDMPPRLQWAENNGYCGETSLQMSALYYGAYISEYAARAAGGSTQEDGQLLLPLDPKDPNVADIGVNLLMGAAALKLNLTRFVSVAGAAQPYALMNWTKAHVMAGRPVIWGVYVSDAGRGWERYDHILPITGYCTPAAKPVATAPVRNDDEFRMPSLFDLDPAWRAASSLPAASTKACKYEAVEGGCLPSKTNYGVAVYGIQGDGAVSLPVRLAVSGNSEPNLITGASPSWLIGTVTVSGLKAGSKYRIFRFNTIAGVPTTGGAAALLKSKPDGSFDFVAKGATYVWKDPKPIKSNGVAYYRAAKLP